MNFGSLHVPTAICVVVGLVLVYLIVHNVFHWL
jgi:hypothetical protein